MTPEQRERVRARIARASQDAAAASDRLHALVYARVHEPPTLDHSLPTTITTLEDTCGTLFHVASALHDLVVELLEDHRATRS